MAVRGVAERAMLGTLRLKLFVVLVVPLVVGVMLACLASYNFLQTSYLTLLDERLTVLTKDIGDMAEANDSIGQPLIALTSMQRRLEREKAQNSDVASIAAFVEDGRIVFGTDRATIGEAIPDAWLPPGGLGINTWNRSTGEELIVGSPIINSFKRPIGGIAVRVSGALVGFRKAEAFRTVALVGIGFLVLGVATAYAAAAQIAGQSSVPILRAAREIDQAATLVHGGSQVPRPEAAEPPPDQVGVVARIARLVAPLDAAEQTLRQLDETA